MWYDICFVHNSQYVHSFQYVNPGVAHLMVKFSFNETNVLHYIYFPPNLFLYFLEHSNRQNLNTKPNTITFRPLKKKPSTLHSVHFFTPICYLTLSYNIEAYPIVCYT